MSVKRYAYLDTSALAKLIIAEPESAVLRRSLARHSPHVASALARAELARSLKPHGEQAIARGEDLLRRISIVKISDKVLRLAGTIGSNQLRTLDAIHLATAQLLGNDLRYVVTYDDRMASAAKSLGMKIHAPA